MPDDPLGPASSPSTVHLNITWIETYFHFAPEEDGELDHLLPLCIQIYLCYLVPEELYTRDVVFLRAWFISYNICLLAAARGD